MPKKKPTQKRLKELLHYDPVTGIPTWKVFRRHNANIGDVAGYINKRGYRIISIDDHPYKASRLAYLYMTGNFPSEEIDHENRIKHDDSWGNLRPLSRLGNNLNRGIMANNTSDVTGVYWNKKLSKWRSAINVNYKYIHLGYFKDKIDAVVARWEAEKKHGFCRFQSSSAAFEYLRGIGAING